MSNFDFFVTDYVVTYFYTYVIGPLHNLVVDTIIYIISFRQSLYHNPLENHN